MLRVSVDIFSGRPNPSWIVTSDDLTQRVVETMTDNPALLDAPEAPFDGLGLRGVKVEILSDDEDVQPPKGMRSFTLVPASAPTMKAGMDLATSLIKEMTKAAKIKLPEHELTPVNKRMQDLILGELRKAGQRAAKPATSSSRASQRRKTIGDAKCDQCQYEISVFNPAFWNSDPAVQGSNNCYNYARNWRTNTFAQPGRASGHPTSTMACGTVSAAAQSDGLVKRCKCLPQSEYPRRLMALVIWPGVDYHWYRHQIGNFWGHKPGSTAARNTDNSNVIITNPETCDRGGYTDFCGYFYAGKNVKIV
jgi:hypothetical protein